MSTNIEKLKMAGLCTNIALLVACGSQKNNQQEVAPNIVYIMCDDHSFQTISAYGHPLSRLAPTPNIDRIANAGMMFTHAYVENSISTPSRACLMTGLYSHQNGQRTLGKGIDTSKVFFTELLQGRGYQTAVVGKWHLQCEPKGFDTYRVLNDQGDYYNPSFKTKETDGQYVQEEGYATTVITDHSINFLENRDRSKPFCLMVHHKAPHRNWMPDGQYVHLYDEVEFPYPDTFYDQYETRCSPARSQEMTIKKEMTMVYDLKIDEWKDIEPYNQEWNVQGWRNDMERFTPEQRAVWNEAYAPRNKKFIEAKLKGDDLLKWKYQHYLKDYLRCIKSIDDEVGRLLDYLDKEGLLENTVIVYTSDQGFYMGEHGWFDKRFMYEESFRTPLIISYPKKITGATVSSALVQNIDFAPTFLNLAGIEQPKEMSGHSLLPLFAGETPVDWRQYLYYHYYDYPAIHQVRRHDGVRDDRYKLIHFYGKGYGKDEGEYLNCDELYDLETDPTELKNLYGQADYKEVQDRLQDQLDMFRAKLGVGEF